MSSRARARPRAGTVRSHEWTAYRRRVLPALRARADGLCERCGEPFDPSAGPRARLAESVDHVHPVAQGGELCAPVEDLRLVHVGCNSKRGNRTRRLPARAIVKRGAAIELAELDAPRPVRYSAAVKNRRARDRAAELAAAQPSLLDVDFLEDVATDRKSVV